jgi:DNA-binding MarR family transcriptional regulator
VAVVESDPENGGGPSPSTSTERILPFLQRRPGAWVNEISRNVDSDPSVVARALHGLESDGHVASERIGKERHFYVQFTPWEKRFLPRLRADESWAILRLVASRPGLDNQGEITARLGLSKDAVAHNAKALARLEVLAKVPIPSERRPGVGYEIAWRAVAPRAARLAAKLPRDLLEAQRLRELLHLRDPRE